MSSTTYEYLLNKYGPTMTFQQASEVTGIYWQTIREMCARGQIKTVRVGKTGRWILTSKAISDFLDGKTEEEEAAAAVTSIANAKGRRRYEKIV